MRYGIGYYGALPLMRSFNVEDMRNGLGDGAQRYFDPAI